MLVPLSMASLDAAMSQNRVQELLALNTELKAHDLCLTERDAADLLQSRGLALRNQGRVELGVGMMATIVRRLSESTYVTQENLVETACGVYEVFHFVKNETSDYLADNELLDTVMLYFERVCGGSVELLMGKGAERIVANFRQHKELGDTAAQKEGEADWITDEQ